MVRGFGSLAGVILFTTSLLADPASEKCALHDQHMGEANKAESRANAHEGHGARVDNRHDTFGMSHEVTTHSFRLFRDGGAIEFRANRSTDAESIIAIRGHLKQVTGQFAKGDFSTPGFVHSYPPDGVARMQTLKSDITYGYEELPTGGRIRIVTSSSEALDAIHAFLKFQVIEHRTADSGQVEKMR